MYFKGIIEIIGSLNIPSSDIKYLINTSKFTSEILLILKHFGYDMSILTNCTVEESFIRVSIKDLIQKLCDYYNISNDRDTLVALSVHILNMKSEFEKNNNVYKTQGLVLDLSTVDAKTKRIFHNKLLADLQLFKTLLINSKEYSKINFSDLDMAKFNLYIAYLIKEYMNTGIDDYIYDKCLDALESYIEDNMNLLESNYEFVIFDGTKEKTFSIRSIRDFINDSNSKRVCIK